MLYELAVVGDLPLPSSSHASVIRSSNQRMLKARTADMSGSNASIVNGSRKHYVGVSQAAGVRKALAPIRPRPPSVTTFTSTDRSALNQALYPKHAHLFGPQEQEKNTRFECDLSPSVFTQNNHANQPSSPEPNEHSGALMDVDTPSMFTTGYAGQSNQAAQTDATKRNTFPLPSSGSSLAENSGSTSSRTMSMNADWMPFTTSSELASKMHGQRHLGHRLPPAAYDTRSIPSPNAPPTGAHAMPRQSEGNPASALPAGSPPLRTATASQTQASVNTASPSSYRQNPPAFVTVSEFIAGIPENVVQSRETLAMWSAAPPGFE